MSQLSSSLSVDVDVGVMFLNSTIRNSGDFNWELFSLVRVG